MANTDEVLYQPVWVTVNWAFLTASLWRMVAESVDSSIWEMFGGDKLFAQDMYPITSDGIEYLPTWDWITQITGAPKSR
jgi:hypothetical protein